jgi:SAM-dependent methyltransferase
MGRVQIQEASVAQLPFSDGMFDVVTAVETHFWWPDVPAGMREILRVLKPGGILVIVAEIYKQAKSRKSELVEKYLPLSGMKLLTIDEHRELFVDAGYSDIQVRAEPSKSWICCSGRKPL